MKNSSPTDTAFDFVNDVEDAVTLSDLTSMFAEATRTFGVEFFVCAQTVLPGGMTKTIRLCCSEQNGWFKHYFKSLLIMDDPLLVIAKNVQHAFTWQWAQQRNNFSKAELQVFSEAARFGYTDGIIIPLHGPSNSSAVFTLSGTSISTLKRDIAAYQVIAQATYEKALEISNLYDLVNGLQNPLSGRQRDCLSWAQYGKSNREIAEILGLSAHTVKEHLDAAKNALGVNTRIEAIVLARNSNFIGSNTPSEKKFNPPLT